MIAAVDTNILLDIFIPSDLFGPESRELVNTAQEAGDVIVCDVVYAELVPAFGNRASLDEALREVNITASSIDTSIAYEAGLRWTRYRRVGGPKERIMADFLIGAHALAEADSLLTRDRGFYGTYFPELARP